MEEGGSNGADALGALGRRPCAPGKSFRPPLGDDAPALGAKCGQRKAGGGNLPHEPGELVHVQGVKGEAVRPGLNQIRGATAAVGHEHGQTAGHGFIHHQAPLFGGAGVDEGPGQAIVSRQLRVLFETGQVDTGIHAQRGP